MSFFPWLGIMPTLDGIIQMGGGIDAGINGQPHDVRRLTCPSPANTSISSQDPVLEGFPCVMRRTTSKVKIEDAIFDLVCFEGTCDNRLLELGDLFQETGYKARANGIYTFVQARPTRESLFIRTESNIAITRPMPTAGQMAQQPASGWAAAPDLTWGGIDKVNESVLTLCDGVYAFAGVNASPASIQCGLQPINKIKDTSRSVAAGKWPVALYREAFLAFVPFLPGETISELDRLNFPNSDRYEVMLVHTSEETGVNGYVCIVEKLGV